ncbi:MAG: hypothetical protein GKR94_33670 [Gammaproteobacteria bacterium]|nr:hypothetical protein [Gammaproteobacteria bacterium]
MLNDIKNSIQTLSQLKGLRNILWITLVSILFMFIFETSTQFFATSSLQEKVELVKKLSEFEASESNKEKIVELQNAVISEAQNVVYYSNSPASYAFSKILAFFKGFYLALPIFYFVLKGLVYIFRKTEDEIQQQYAVLSAMLFSAVSWFATLLGLISAIWNKSENILVSWVVFPISSAIIFTLFLIWLLVLQIIMYKGESKKTKDEE